MPLITAEQALEVPIYGTRDRAAYSESASRLTGTSGPPKIPRDRIIQKVELLQRFFVVGKTVLELERNPILLIDVSRREFEVVGWNMKLPYGKEQTLGRELIRKFLFLFHKAEQIELSEAEEVEWANIVERVNYRRFCLDRARPRYCEGTLIERDEVACRIEWDDGSKERIGAPLTNELGLLDVGERFGVYAKFASENRLSSLSNVKVLPRVADDAQQMWNEWPTNR